MEYLSLFSGIGTGEKGIEQAFEQHYGINGTAKSAEANLCRSGSSSDVGGQLVGRESRTACIGFAEIDRHAEAIYKYHWPGHRNYGDASQIVCDELPDFDFLIAGFPCQSFSIAGKRQGFNEARGTLFFEIARILSHKRPKHFLLENVRGLVSHDSGKTIDAIFRILADLGYFVEATVLNSKDYGVPQNRERVFFIGHLADECAGEILSFGENGSGFIERPEQSTVANCFTAGGHSGGMHSSMTLIQMDETKGNSQGGRVYHTEGIASGLKSQGGGGSAKCPMIVDTEIAHADRVGGRGSYGKKQNWDCYEVAVPVLTPDRPSKRQNGRRFKEDGDPAFTLTAQDRHGVMIEMPIANCLTPDAYLTKGERKRDENGKALLTSMHERRIRRLTPIECERLQGVRDNFTKLGRYGDEIKEVSDTQRYKTLGNSFTVDVIEAIVSRMLEVGCLE